MAPSDSALATSGICKGRARQSRAKRVHVARENIDRPAHIASSPHMRRFFLIYIYIFDSAKFSLLGSRVKPAEKAEAAAPAWRQFTRLPSQANDLIYNVSIFIKLCRCDNVLLEEAALVWRIGRRRPGKTSCRLGRLRSHLARIWLAFAPNKKSL